MGNGYPNTVLAHTLCFIALLVISVDQLFMLACFLLAQFFAVGQAYTSEEWDLLQGTINAQFPNVSLSSLHFLEFGSQIFESHDSENYDLFAREGFHTYGKASPYFIRHLGYQHVSVDMNRRESALPLDCRQDITMTLKPQRFDIITNMKFR